MNITIKYWKGKRNIRLLLVRGAAILTFLFLLVSLPAQNATVRKQSQQKNISAAQACAVYKDVCKELYCKYVTAKETFEKARDNPPTATTEEEELKISSDLSKLSQASTAAYNKYMHCKSITPPPNNKSKTNTGDGSISTPDNPPDDNPNNPPGNNKPPPKTIPDTDGDGVKDPDDRCANTPKDVQVDVRGCPYQNRLSVLSPRSGQVFIVESIDDRLHIPFDVEVIAPKNDLTSTDVSYTAPEGMQGDGLAISKSGGRGKGSIVVQGLGPHTMLVTARFNEGATLQQSIQIRVEMPSPKLNALQSLHQLQQQSMETIRQKVQTTQLKQNPLQQELKEIDDLIQGYEETIQDIDQKIKEVAINPPPAPAIGPSPQEIIAEIQSDLNDWTTELGEWDEWLDLLDDLEDVEEVEDIIKWTEEDETTTIQTAPKEQKTVYSEVNDVYLVIDGNSKIVKTIDLRNPVVKIVDGTLGYFKDLYYSTKDVAVGLKKLVLNEEYTDEDVLEQINRIMDDPMRQPLVINGKYIELVPMNTAFEITVDPSAGREVVNVFHGPVLARSLSGQFLDQVLESRTTLIVGREGIISKEQRDGFQMMEAGRKYEDQLGGINPTALEHNGRPEAGISIMPDKPKIGEPLVVASTSTDPEGEPLQLEWYIDGMRMPELSNQPYFEFTNTQQGALRISLAAVDSKGGRSLASSITYVSSPGEDLLTPRNIAIAGVVLLVLVMLLGRRR